MSFLLYYFFNEKKRIVQHKTISKDIKSILKHAVKFDEKLIKFKGLKDYEIKAFLVEKILKNKR